MQHSPRLEDILEAILFSSGEPVSVARLAQAAGVDEVLAQRALQLLAERYEAHGSIELLALDGSYQLCTQAQYAPYIRAALAIKRDQPLSQAALEVLAVIAYNQPVTRAFVEQVRGVDSSGVITNLVEKQLVEEKGRMDLPGRPIAYGTTENFLRCFGLHSLAELPQVPTDEEPAPVKEEPEIEGQVSFGEIPG